MLSDEEWRYTWEHGRQLARMSNYNNDDYGWDFTYDAGGMRTQRSNGSTTYKYVYNGSQLTWMQVGGVTMQFVYSAAGTPLALIYNGHYYYYVTNIQGDVIAILNDAGEELVTYTYDAWGNVAVDSNMGLTLGDLNPLRYRGYVYDYETGLYYLQSRYYNPEIGRFINADDISFLGAGDSVISYNLFAYCGNNPVMGYDPTGHWDWGTFFSGAGLISTGVTAITIALTVLTCGAAAPLMIAVAGVTLAAGALTAVNGVAEVIEAGTGYNAIRDGFFGGDAQAYGIYRDITSAVAEVGTAILGTYYAAKGGNVCFIAGTLVQGADGTIPIETVVAGDLVWAWDEETGEVALKEVVQTFVNEATELVHVTFNGEEIVCTNEHPFYSPVKGWTEACRLRAGDILVTVNGEYVVVEKVQHEILESPVTVYNFEVEGFHTYYVSDAGVLVHNLCDATSSIKNSKSLVNEANKLTGTIQQEIDSLIMKFRMGNANPGLGTKFLSGDIYYLRGRNGARVFYRMVNGTMDILGKASKANEQAVINLVLKIFG